MNNNLAPLMSRASDEWATPQELFDKLNAEFRFDLDAAANKNNHKLEWWLGPNSPYGKSGEDALTVGWYGSVWLNCPYSKIAAFTKKASEEVASGRASVIVSLMPARPDTRYFHDYIWDRCLHQPQEGREIRFLKGRLRFGDSTNSAPFPSMIVIFR